MCECQGVIFFAFMMKEEIEAAVHFVGRVITSSNDGNAISCFKEFKTELHKVMEEKFQGHWHDDSPGKGQGYRSIRFHPQEPLDPVLSMAAQLSKLSITYLRIPVELTVWVDPKDVTCRFGDLKSTYCSVLKDQENQSNTLDVDELMENAKALYSRQQNFVIYDGPQPIDLPYMGTDMAHFAMPVNGYSGDNYLYPAFPFFPAWTPEPSVDGSPQYPPYGPPPILGLNTTPRKNGKNHFRKGSNGTGRGSKHQHHHQHHHNHHGHGHHHHGHPDGGGGFHLNGQSHNMHNGIGNHSSSNGSIPNGSTGTPSRGPSSSSGARFQLVKGTKNAHQFYALPQGLHHFAQQQQHHHHQQQQQQQHQHHTTGKKRLNSESDKDQLAK